MMNPNCIRAVIIDNSHNRHGKSLRGVHSEIKGQSLSRLQYDILFDRRLVWGGLYDLGLAEK